MTKNQQFYQGKTVLVTGHMGFKGTWLCAYLNYLGAKVIGYGLKNDVHPVVFDISDMESRMTSITGDVRDVNKLTDVCEKYKPEIVFHLAAQPIVLKGYENPVETYATNVMGTVNVMEAVRKVPSIKSVVNVTTDKVYRNLELDKPFAEEDVLDGIDPYSNSKSCSELVTATYIRSFFEPQQEEGRKISVSTVRAGNVIGGGDFSKNRIIPDCIRAQQMDGVIKVRNPYSIRPYQHVLEALGVYLMVARMQWEYKELAGAYNVGPAKEDCLKTGQLVDLFCENWGEKASWEVVSVDNPKEAGFLRLDCGKLSRTFGWKPMLSIKDAMKLTVEWEKAYEEKVRMVKLQKKDGRAYIKMYDVFEKQIAAYENLMKE